jgi:hypothetical protein
MAVGHVPNDGRATSWLRIKNHHYLQAEGRHELFERRRSEYEGHGRTLIRTDLVLA